jgi:hypothetical protein
MKSGVKAHFAHREAKVKRFWQDIPSMESEE